MEILLGSILVAAAFLLAWSAARWAGTNKSDKGRYVPASIQERLPRIGEPGTARPDQRRLLVNYRLRNIDYRMLSAEQAEVLLDCITYVTSVWEVDLHRQAADLPDRSIEESLGLILDHSSYRERVVRWDLGREDAGSDVFIPDEACHAVVKGHLLQAS